KAALTSAFGELRALIEREGGTVEKYIGDEIYALFGAPVAHEDDPARALRAADAARVWSRGRRGPDVGFDVRVGVETGEAIIDLLAIAHRRATDRSVLVLVSGPPGQGKTRLVERFIDSLGEVRLLSARCRPGGEIGALAPLREILIGERSDNALDEIVAAAIDDPTERARARDPLA